MESGEEDEPEISDQEEDEEEEEWTPSSATRPKKKQRVSRSAAVPVRFRDEDVKPAKKARKKRVTKTPRKKKAVPLTKRLGCLSKEELVSVVGQFFEDIHPELLEEFSENIPKPGLREVQLELDRLERSYNKAFPHNKFGSNLDRYAFKRVRAPLNAFKKALVDQANLLKTSGQFDVLLEYITTIAVDMTDNMPDWNDASSKTAQNSAYKTLNVCSKMAITKADLTKDELLAYKSTFTGYNGTFKPTVDAIDKKLNKM